MSPASPALARVARGDLCAGCGACAALAPGAVRMVERGGFPRPEVVASPGPEAEAAIGATCPGLGMTQAAGGRARDPLWGPTVALWQGHARDPALRHAGASGGALSAILVHLIESGAVDAAIAIAPDPADPRANATVTLRDRAGVLAAAGSRYAPSAPLAGLGALLEGPERHAFVGKPCDVAALRAWARLDPRIDARIPWMLSFFCAGVPGLGGASELLAALGVAERDLAALRYRGHGWPGRATARRRDGSEASMSYAESWGAILSRHVQWRCRICPDGTGGFADLVAADAWECDAAGYPVFEERPGVSLLVARTERGRALAEAAAAAGHVALAPFEAGRIAAIQPGQLRRKRVALARLWAMAAAGRPVPRFRGFDLWRAARTGPAGDFLRNFLGAWRRLIAPRRRRGPAGGG